MKCFPIADSTWAVLRFCFFWILAIWTSQSMRGFAGSASSFPTPYNTREKDSRFLKPDEALKTIHLPSGFHATLFAAEPDVQQPIGLTLDQRGRLWVAENYTYSQRPLGWDTNLCDRILILEDTNHDGHFDKRTVFWD